MVDEKYDSGELPNVNLTDFVTMRTLEIEMGITNFAISGVASHMAGLEVSLEKEKRAKGWNVIAQYHRN